MSCWQHRSGRFIPLLKGFWAAKNKCNCTKNKQLEMIPVLTTHPTSEQERACDRPVSLRGSTRERPSLPGAAGERSGGFALI